MVGARDAVRDHPLRLHAVADKPRSPTTRSSLAFERWCAVRPPPHVSSADLSPHLRTQEVGGRSGLANTWYDDTSDSSL